MIEGLRHVVLQIGKPSANPKNLHYLHDMLIICASLNELPLQKIARISHVAAALRSSTEICACVLPGRFPSPVAGRFNRKA